MRIKVRLFGGLARYRPGDAPGSGPFDMDVTQGATVAMIVEILRLPAGLARVRVVNGALTDPERVLEPEDELLLAPAASGGSA